MAAIPAFKGFTPQTFQFFKDLKENNYKEWFDEHKHIYESELMLPLKSLVTTLSPAMYNIDPAFELRPHRAISRIYRDTRFSKNKDPYKTFMWLTFQIPLSTEVWKDYPGYFVEVNAETYTIGLGLFMPKKKVMDAFRDEVSYNSDEFQRETQRSVFDRGFSIGGEEYKRPIANDLPEYFQPWIQRKGVWVEKTKPIGPELYKPEFADILRADFEALQWLYDFMKEATQL